MLSQVLLEILSDQKRRGDWWELQVLPHIRQFPLRSLKHMARVLALDVSLDSIERLAPRRVSSTAPQ